METEVTVEVRAKVRWRIEDGQPVVDGVEILGSALADAETARRIAAALRPDGGTVH